MSTYMVNNEQHQQHVVANTTHTINSIPPEILVNILWCILPSKHSYKTLPLISRRFNQAMHQIPKSLFVKLTIKKQPPQQQQAASTSSSSSSTTTDPRTSPFSFGKMTPGFRWVSILESGNQYNNMNPLLDTSIISTKKKPTTTLKRKPYMNLGTCDIVVNPDSIPQDPTIMLMFLRQFIVDCACKGVVIGGRGVQVVFERVDVDYPLLDLPLERLERVFKVVGALKPVHLFTFYNDFLPKHLSHPVQLYLTPSPNFKNFNQFGPAAEFITTLVLSPPRRSRDRGFETLEGLDSLGNVTSLTFMMDSVSGFYENLRRWEMPRKVKEISISQFNPIGIDMFITLTQKCPNLQSLMPLTVDDPDFCNRLHEYAESLEESHQELTMIPISMSTTTTATPLARFKNFHSVWLTYTRIDVMDLMLLAEGFHRAFPNALYLNIEFNIPHDDTNNNNGNDLNNIEFGNSDSACVDLVNVISPEQFLRIVKLFDGRCPVLNNLCFGFYEEGWMRNCFVGGGASGGREGGLERFYRRPVRELKESGGLRVNVRVS
ncbi:hypothetical protein HDU76_001750 [Blyttiomyces sp. JEL0837]|nr:hypothetical protein HDU76_001750 [Blyttiomyces sp. JEL0837]